MQFLTAFAVTLLIAVLVSGLAQRSILSTAVLFLLAGFVVGPDGAGIVAFKATDPFVEMLVVVTLFSVLFTDGMLVGFNDLRRAWRLPGRALIFGMPLTLLLIGVLAHWITGLGWTESFLLAAILTPTDPVFAAALVGRQEVPASLRHLLNVESGLNDGLALPVVIMLLAMAKHAPLMPLRIIGELAAAIVLGVAIPWIAIGLEKSKYFGASAEYRPLNAFAIGLLVLTICNTTRANEYLAAFAAGVTIATADPKMRQAFRQFGSLISELLKLASLLAFGSLISLQFVGEIKGWDYLFAAAALLVVRPIALGISLLGSTMPWRQRAVAAWFGPKGFASVAYGILVLKNDIPNAERIFHMVAIVIAGSIILHSSTDVPAAGIFAKAKKQQSGN